MTFNLSNAMKMLSLFFVLFLCIGMVSAEDNQTDVSDVFVTGSNFGDIQDAVDIVEEGSTVNLEAKTYSPTAKEIDDYSDIRINKSVNIVGVYNKTTINAKKSMGAFNIADADDVKIENIIFTKASPAVFISNSNVTFKSCQFNSNKFSMGGAVSITGGNTNFIDCIFKDNVAKGMEASVGGAIAVMESNGYTTSIVNSQFTNNAAARGGAIYVVGDNSKAGYININNSRFNLNKVLYDVEEEFAAGDIAFYNIGGSKQIKVNLSIDNSSFVSTDNPERVDRDSPSLYLANNNNIIKNSNFTNYVMVLWGAVKMELDNCNLENLEMYCYNKKNALVSGSNQLTVNNSNLKNAHLDSGSGLIQNTNFDSNSCIDVCANTFDMVNSTFTKNSYVSLSKGNLSIVKSSFADSTIEMNFMSDDIKKAHLNFVDVEFKNKVKLDAASSRTSFNNCIGLGNIISPVTFSYTTLTTYYKSGKSFTLKVINSNTNKVLKNFKVTLKVYKGSKLVKTYRLTTNNNGKASFKASSLVPGSYIVKTTLPNNSYYFNGHSSLIKITKIKTTVKAPKVTAKYKKSKYFKVTVKHKNTKKLVKNVKVKIKVFTGKKYKVFNAKTNKKGIAKINTKKLKKGSHKVVITSGNSHYVISAKSTIKIK